MDTGAQKGEIDLLDIAVGSVRSVIKNLTWVILITLSGGIGGYLTSKFSLAYESQLMIKARRVKDTELAFILLGYQKRRLPGITKKEADDYIKDFSFTVQPNRSQPEQEKQNPETFASIIIKVSDSTLFPKIQTAIIERMNNEKVVKNYYAIDKQVNSKVIAEYKDKIRRAENLIERKPGEETVALFPEVVNMRTQLAEAEAVHEQPIVTAVTDFEPIHTRINAITATILGLIVGLILSAVFIAIRAFVSHYKKVTAGT